MNTNYSLTQSGNLLTIAGCIVLIFAHFGIQIASDEVVTILTGIGVIVSWYGRYRKGDISLAGFRKI